MKIRVMVSECRCPKCGAEESHPHDAHKPLLERRILIRGFKVQTADGHWWSQCLVCAGAYDPTTLTETPDKFNRDSGWF